MAIPVTTTLVPPGYFETLGQGNTPQEQIEARRRWCQQHPLRIEWPDQTLPVNECVFDFFRSPPAVVDPEAPLGRAPKEVKLWNNGVEIHFPPDRVALRNTCIDTLNTIETLVQTQLGRHPVNTISHKMSVYLDFGTSSACWNGNKQVVCFGPLTDKYCHIKPDGYAKAATVVGHEFGHSLVQYYGANGSGLVYKGETGALNESLADVLGIMTKHWILKNNANSPDTDWKIGKIFRPGTYHLGENVITFNRHHALRSMSNPGSANPRDCQLTNTKEPIDHYSKYRKDLEETEDDDWGGVHYNSGIPNKAFYLAATALQGPTWDKVGKIWFEALYASSSTIDFSKFAALTAKKAKSLYTTQEENLVRKAWTDVGVTLVDDSLSLGQQPDPSYQPDGFPMYYARWLAGQAGEEIKREVVIAVENVGNSISTPFKRIGEFLEEERKRCKGAFDD